MTSLLRSSISVHKNPRWRRPKGRTPGYKTVWPMGDVTTTTKTYVVGAVHLILSLEKPLFIILSTLIIIIITLPPTPPGADLMVQSLTGWATRARRVTLEESAVNLGPFRMCDDCRVQENFSFNFYFIKAQSLLFMLHCSACTLTQEHAACISEMTFLTLQPRGKINKQASSGKHIPSSHEGT